MSADPRPDLDPLGDFLRRAADRADDPALRQWLTALADSDERATGVVEPPAQADRPRAVRSAVAR